MKRVLICTIVLAFTFGLSAAAHAAVISGEQKGTDNGGNKAENNFNWSHEFKYSGQHDADPFKFNYSFGSSQGNQSGQQSQNGQGDASKWSHSNAFKGTLDAPLKFSFGSSQGNQGGQQSQNGQGDASKWSHSQAFKGTLDAPLKFSFGSSQGNQDGYQSSNGLLNAFEWAHSIALSGEQQENPFSFNYQYGLSIDVDGGYMSMNGPEYTQWQGDVLDTAQHFYYYESYGIGSEPDTGYIPPNNSQPAPEPVSILLMGLGGVWIATRRKV